MTHTHTHTYIHTHTHTISTDITKLSSVVNDLGNDDFTTARTISTLWPLNLNAHLSENIKVILKI